ncbi:MAG TPA: SRPBCC family protein [Ilumatobacteraceae bacterium]|nr:SRPBCC family protein [Ilumatobacteraceae bacterium]
MATNTPPLTGSASITIDRPAAEVFAAVSDVTRMGEWSPECVACRWADGDEGPAVGSKFSGDNVAKAGPITLKKWTTTSEITGFEPDAVFEFVAEGYSTWRYEFEDRGGSTLVTESFSFPSPDGVQKFLYETVMRRSKSMVKGMEATLGRLKAALES